MNGKQEVGEGGGGVGVPEGVALGEGLAVGLAVGLGVGLAVALAVGRVVVGVERPAGAVPAAAAVGNEAVLGSVSAKRVGDGVADDVGAGGNPTWPAADG